MALPPDPACSHDAVASSSLVRKLSEGRSRKLFLLLRTPEYPEQSCRFGFKTLVKQSSVSTFLNQSAPVQIQLVQNPSARLLVWVRTAPETPLLSSLLLGLYLGIYK